MRLTCISFDPHFSCEFSHNDKRCSEVYCSIRIMQHIEYKVNHEYDLSVCTSISMIFIPLHYDLYQMDAYNNLNHFRCA